MVDLDPHFTETDFGIFPYFIVNFAFSIIASYSVIEEIGLEIRASPKNPSKIRGKWNPEVKIDLESRLQRARIDFKQKVPWALRGKPTKIEMARQPKAIKKCEWACGPYIRDIELEVVDAINHASFLRSKISSHKLDSKIASLTSYDVENVRRHAIRLLLEKLGIKRWNIFVQFPEIASARSRLAMAGVFSCNTHYVSRFYQAPIFNRIF